MKMIFECLRGEVFDNLNQTVIRNTRPDLHEPEKRTVFVPLEIKASTLERLIKKHYLVAEELHCKDKTSKDVVRQAILDALI